MAETESITVAEVSDGPCGSGRPGRAVDLPVVELLTGRGFVTGKSGSGKSNTASVVVEKLLDSGFGMLIVDVDGEYYGLKEEYEILHVGDDDECDIQVTVDHAEKIASLALEQNVPVILDVSSFLDEGEAQELLTEVARRLFAKAKKRKQPFLLIVEECHEYMPQQGSVGECGKMLIKISKRGRKHGLGVLGISQRPADVKKDFITQCDWLVWHRLTWNNDTKVVKRILDADYAGAVEDLDDGEAFMMTDWSDRVRRVQFQRKQTFDAGATPGLDDFERPDLKSVSDDLVSELEAISEAERERETRVAELREELDRKNSRIAELEAELQDARDLQRMADQFTQALVEHVAGANPGRTEQQQMRDRRRRSNGDWSTDRRSTERAANGRSSGESVGEDDSYATVAMPWPGADSDEPGDQASVDGAAANDGAANDGTPAGDGAAADDGTAAGDGTGEADDWMFGADAPPAFDEEPSPAKDEDAATFGADVAGSDTEAPATFDDAGPAFDDASALFGDGGESPSGDGQFSDRGEGSESAADAGPAVVTRGFAGVEDDPLGDRATAAFENGTSTAIDDEAVDGDAFARRLADDLRDLAPETREMLRYYREEGPGTPMDALFSAGGFDDRTAAYARNRRLRVRGLIEHVGRGRYDYCVPDLLRERTEDDRIDRLIDRVELSIPGGSSESRAASGAD